LEQIVGVFAWLAQVQQHHFCLAVVEPRAEHPIKRIDRQLGQQRKGDGFIYVVLGRPSQVSHLGSENKSVPILF
jgi:hypothetical protein